ncbi:MAG: hypothetical protein M3546_09570 [Actinomycetota bacterium]|nr:hypothetical protein [Actinomycetota bacterium]
MSADVGKLQREAARHEAEAEKRRRQLDELLAAEHGAQLKRARAWDESFVAAYHPQELERAIAEARRHFREVLVAEPWFDAFAELVAAGARPWELSQEVNEGLGRLRRPLVPVPPAREFGFVTELTSAAQAHAQALRSDEEDERIRARDAAISLADAEPTAA